MIGHATSLTMILRHTFRGTLIWQAATFQKVGMGFGSLCATAAMSLFIQSLPPPPRTQTKTERAEKLPRLYIYIYTYSLYHLSLPISPFLSLSLYIYIYTLLSPSLSLYIYVCICIRYLYTPLYMLIYRYTWMCAINIFVLVFRHLGLPFRAF